MDILMEIEEEELERLARRKARREQMFREKQLQLERRRKMKKLLHLGGRAAVILAAVGIIGLGAIKLLENRNTKEEDQAMVEAGNTSILQEAVMADNGSSQAQTEIIVQETEKSGSLDDKSPIEFNSASDQKYIYNEEIISTNAVLIDEKNNVVIAGKEEKQRISPASMTKVLTILVAAEQLEESRLEDTFIMTREITDYGFINDCSSVGFLEGEEVAVKDLFYGTILPSGADAAVGLATYVAGSQEAFVELMNKTLESLGIGKTSHFTNCVGVYDENHYSTVYDMAVIMKAAISNEFCKKVLSEHTYTTASTPQHPEGITISNWFLRRIEDKDAGGTVLCAKTGFVNESGSCAVSYGNFKDGTPYICVTVGAYSSWRCIYDHVEIYNRYV
ncbi:MAG: D-alanyl-D-alanine carboxypeptidase [Lachnospiraceae bacterium]|nr:D-alanyl-D-alanine carboxypeptidase [Lachnospiraceae bacterium]